jgi:hypothetical protein
MSNSQTTDHDDHEDEDHLTHPTSDWLQWLRDQVIEENDDDEDDDDDADDDNGFTGESITLASFLQPANDALVGGGDVEFEVVIAELPAGSGEGESSNDVGDADRPDITEPHRRVVRIGRGMCMADEPALRSIY